MMPRAGGWFGSPFSVSLDFGFPISCFVLFAVAQCSSKLDFYCEMLQIMIAS